MILNPRNLCHYLLDKGYLDAAAVVNGLFQIKQIASRNTTFKISLPDGTGYILKQASRNQSETTESLRQEATIYWLANNDPDFGALKPFLPTFYHYDAGNHHLLLGLFAGAEDLHTYYYQQFSFPVEIARQQGKILAAFHTGLAQKIEKRPAARFFQKKLPWIFSVAADNPYWEGKGREVDKQLVGLVQQNQEYIRFLEEIKQEWQVDSLLHGDIKWANFLKSGTATLDAPFEVKLIDWELADLGDACWDLAGLLQSYLSLWAFSQGSNGSQNDIMAALNPSLRVFWQTYAAERQYSKEEAQLQLTKAMKFTGVRLVQTCLEATAKAPYLQANVVKNLQLGLNILKHPKEATSILLGLN
ncbi:MAG: phosphotransferase family protein [Adhaeribacter sp.]|nr:phosphotransferase family protein [Adhaeribacter sp.]